MYINVDHAPLTDLSRPNLSKDHKVSQVIEPVVNTITDAIKKTFVDYRSHQADRRTVNPPASSHLNFNYNSGQNNEEIISNDINDNYNYGFPLDYYEYDIDISTKVSTNM